MAVFEVGADNLSGLGPEKSVELVRRMVRAAAYASHIPITKFDMPCEIDAPDGGVDGEVESAADDSIYGIIKKGTTCYQVKSGGFAPNDGGIRKLFFNGSKLKPRIRSCLDKDGTFVVIFTGWDSPDKTDGHAVTMIKEHLAAVSEKYRSAKVEVWRQNKIINILNHFPSLRLYVLGRGLGPLFMYDDWLGIEEGGKARNLYLGEGQKRFISEIRTRLCADGEINLRVIGEPGIGKTRLVLESVSDDGLRGSVLYCPSPESLAGDNILDEISRLDDRSNMILIVDDCSSDKAARVWSRIKPKAHNIKLVTIFNEPYEHETAFVLVLPELGDDELGKILEEYVEAPADLSKWIQSCRPSPRVAHIVGRNLRGNPKDIFRPPDTVPVWDRYISGWSLQDTDEFDKRRTVMLWLSLFKKFGFEGQYAGEGDAIARIIRENTGMEKGIFLQTVKKLKEMKILQGHSTLYMTPKILHVYFWTQWWRQYGETLMSDVVGSLAKQGPLFGWYCEMFAYAKESVTTRSLVSKLLEPGGFFDNNEALKTQLGADFFLILSRADGHAALGYLERFIRDQTREELLGFETGRREVIHVLDTMAGFEDTFDQSAMLLLALAEAENEPCSNSATGVFCDLFVPATSRIARTCIPPASRLPTLRRVMASDPGRDIAVKACSNALEKVHVSAFTTNMGAFKKDPGIWTPESDGEIMSYYVYIMDLLAGLPDQRQAAEIMLESLQHLLRVPVLGGAALDVAEKMHGQGTIKKEPLLECVIRAVDSGMLEPTMLGRLEDLQRKLAGTGYVPMMKRYVGTDAPLDWTGTGGSGARRAKIESLATESLDRGKLEPELDWLVTDEAKCGDSFGYELAARDAGYSLLPALLGALKRAGDRASGFFVSGYLRRMRERDQTLWEGRLGTMYGDPSLCGMVPELVFRSGPTNRTARMICDGIREGRSRRDVLDMYGYGGAVDELSEDVVLDWIDLLLHADDARITTALYTFYMYFVRRGRKAIPKVVALDLLLHESLMSGNDPTEYGPMGHHHWKEIGLEFVRQYPGDSVAILDAVCKSMGRNNFFDQSRREIYAVLDEIVRCRPSETWRAISKYMESTLDGRACAIQDWLRGGLVSDSGIISEIPFDEIAAWVDEDMDARAAYVAKMLPSEFDISRKFLIKYHNVNGVDRQITLNFDIESWQGSSITYYAEKKKKFKDLRNAENDPGVRAWLDRYIEHISTEIKESVAMEERGLRA